MNFRELKIFENENINALCDRLCRYCEEQSGEIPVLTGSVAKMLHGGLENHTPKDVDFVVSYSTFRNLIVRLDKMEGVVMIEKRPFRIVLYVETDFCIEVWLKSIRNETMNLNYYQNKIPYLWQNQ